MSRGKSHIGVLSGLWFFSFMQSTQAAPPPQLTAQRYTEDYSYLADPANRTGAWWENFKWISLDSSGSIRLNLGEDLLADHHWYSNNPFAPDEELSDEDFLLFRTSPYADLHLGSRLRAFGQFVGSWTTRSSQSKTPAEETDADFLQGFVDWSAPIGSRDSFTLRAGRQVVSYGSERLIAPGRFVRRSFDGGVARLSFGAWSADAFFLKPVRVGLSPFDDQTDPSRSLWSLYTTRNHPGQRAKSGGVDFYYIGFKNNQENRHTLGSRYFGDSGAWKWDTEAMLQFGSFSDSKIRAWALASSISHGALGLRANVISGDRDGDTLGTFNAMFPANRYFGYLNLIGPANLMNLRPIATIQLNKNWTLIPSAVFYWRESLSDGVYGPRLNPVSTSQEFEGRFTGAQAELLLGWTPNRNFGFWAVYSAFEPNSGKMTQLFLLETSFRL